MAADALSGIISSMETDKNLEALSQAAEAAERYEDMVKIMTALAEKKIARKESLTPDQRNLLSVAFKNVVGAKRSSWRFLNDDHDDIKAELLKDYRVQVEKELDAKCQKVLNLLEDLQNLNKDTMADAEKGSKDHKTYCEAQVFYLKMIGDYYRYLTETFKENENYKGKCKNYYSDAMALAKEQLESTHPTRLGLALNFSVCYYEILEQPDEACKLAKEAFDEAIEKLDSLNDVSYKDSTLIMQLLRDNLTIWNQQDGVEQ